MNHGKTSSGFAPESTREGFLVVTRIISKEASSSARRRDCQPRSRRKSFKVRLIIGSGSVSLLLLVAWILVRPQTVEEAANGDNREEHEVYRSSTTPPSGEDNGDDRSLNAPTTSVTPNEISSGLRLTVALTGFICRDRKFEICMSFHEGKS